MPRNGPAMRQRRREALDWVISHLPDQTEFTSHDVASMAEILRDQKWPPYLKAAWKRVGMRLDTIGHALTRHPDFEKHPTDPLSDQSVRGVRVRSARWIKR